MHTRRLVCTILVDILFIFGTYKSSNRYQHSFYFKFVIIFCRAFILAPDQTEETIVRIFVNLNESCGPFSPISFGVDFEKSLSNAIIKVFGEDCEIWYCFFHLGQNVVRYVSRKDAVKFRQDKDFATRVRCLTALAFLPVEEVVEAFEELIQWDKNQPEPKLPADLVNYFEKNYIGKLLRTGRKQRKIPR